MAALLAKVLLLAAWAPREAVALTTHVAPDAAGESACSCREWAQTYRAGVRCGQTMEFHAATNKKALSGPELFLMRATMGNEFCTKFYEMLHNNLCVNANMGEDRGQWCYVSANCTELRGGERLTNLPFAWKMCGAEDKGLRSFSPNALAKMANEADLDLGLLHKMSYPLYQKNLWKEVEAAWDEDTEHELSSPLLEEMKHIQDSGEAISFDTSKDRHPPHRIVQGKKVYAVEPSKSLVARPFSPGSWNTLKCVHNCKQ